MNIKIDLYLGINLSDTFTKDYKTKSSKVKQGSITTMYEEMRKMFYSSDHKVIITNSLPYPPYKEEKVSYISLLNTSYIGLKLDYEMDFGVNWFNLDNYEQEIKAIKKFILDLYCLELEPKFFINIED